MFRAVTDELWSATCIKRQGRPLKFELQQTSVWFGQSRALRDVSLAIPERTVVAVIGPPGSGKSTFLRLLNRMNDDIPTCRLLGTVRYEGKDIYSSNTNLPQLRRRVGMVFPHTDLFPMSIFDNVTFAPRLASGYNRTKLSELAEKSLKQAHLWLDVKDRLHESVDALEPSQRQRLSLARTLAAEPEVLLIDETTAILNTAARTAFEDLLDDLKENYTIVLVPQSMQQAARVSDWTFYFHAGRLVEANPTHKVFTTPDRKQTENFITGRTEA